MAAAAISRSAMIGVAKLDRMRLHTTKRDIRATVSDWRNTGARIAFVPTMGYLHDGHLALVRHAKREADRVVVSIFVNPTQFESDKDFSTYPRDNERDFALLRAEGVDGVFVPDRSEVYGDGPEAVVDVPQLSDVLLGALRPGHFRGVATVVVKLLNIVRPDCAVFGEKDYQQLQVIRAAVAWLDLDVTIIGHPTVREPDGLAMSSRNVLMSPEDRAASVVLSRALDLAAASDLRDGAAIEGLVRAELVREGRADVQSVDVCDAITLEPAPGSLSAPVVVLLSVRFGTVLLIDQRVIAP